MISEGRLLRIRRDLGRAQPVLGRLASFLRVEIAPGLGAEVETGDDHLLFDAAYAERADDAELRFWLAHAALHAALLHFDPPPGRPGDWSKACDDRVNALLRPLGFMPPAAPVTERHAWWNRTGGEGGEAARRRGGGAVEDETPSDAMLQARRRLWQARVRQAVGEALGTGETHGGLLRALTGQVADAATHDWRGQLSAFLQRWHRAEPHYGRPSRRAVEPFLLPVLKPAAVHLLVAVDTSASIDETQLRAFWAEVQGLTGQMPVELTLLAADTRIAEGAPWRFGVGEVPLWPEPHGQGGTDFRPVFEWMDASGERFDALVYFTDGRGDYPPEPPGLPVLWAMPGDLKPFIGPPFGEVIRW